MKLKFSCVALSALMAVACSGGGSSDGGAAGGGLSEGECRAIVDKSRSLSGMPDGVFVEESEQTIQQCDASTSVSRADYDCAMAASDAAAFASCRIDVLN